MKYFITYRMKSDQEFHIVGPYNYFEYVSEAMYIISQDEVYDLDFVNEMAMDVYNTYKEVENEYEQARIRLVENPGASHWTLQNEVDAAREYKKLPQEIMRTLFPLEGHDMNIYIDVKDTIKTLDTLEYIGVEYDPYDFPF